jgi:cleavage and polyadenylation specificity factor subunit 1
MGVYEWLRVPMGLKGAPSYFQQMMASVVLAGLLYFICELYIDDLLIHARTEQEFIDRHRQIFERLRRHRVTLNPEKALMGVEEVDYVGHLVTKDGIRFSEEKLSGVRDFPKPMVRRELKSFVGLAGYFRDHVSHFAELMRPLNDELGAYTSGDRNVRIAWSEQLSDTFEKVKLAIDKCAKLYFIDGTSPLYLDTDASQYGIGAYLYQLVQDVEQPIMFISKSLTKTQVKWNVPEKECYAIFYSLIKMQHLLRDVHFTLCTDHENLTRIYNSGSDKVWRWKNKIQEFDFECKHIDGENNFVADHLSRLCPMTDRMQVITI